MKQKENNKRQKRKAESRRLKLDYFSHKLVREHETENPLQRPHFLPRA